MEKRNHLESSELGKESKYVDKYTPNILYPIPRSNRTVELYGYDLWHLYELSWLDGDGKPNIGIGNLVYEASSQYLIESKSLKLYLNSFNNSKFTSKELVKETIENDLSSVLSTEVRVEIFDVNDEYSIMKPSGVCIDSIKIVEPSFEHGKTMFSSLIESDEIVYETIYSELLRSNCPVTGQPDWGTITVEYTGRKISHRALLQCILSYRNHNDFHEQCVEDIYTTIMTACNPDSLKVFANYTRRGGIDINPYRFDKRDFDIDTVILDRTRLARQ